MSYINSTRGSEWRRWDLHIHTPFTKLANGYIGESEDDIWNRYIDFLEGSPIEAFGITEKFNVSKKGMAVIASRLGAIS